MRLYNNNKGFSLVEIMVAIAILAIAASSLFAGFAQAGRIHAKATKLQMAEDVAQKVAEEFKLYSLDELKTAMGVGHLDADGNPTGNYTNVASSTSDATAKATEYTNYYSKYVDSPDVTDIISMHEFSDISYSFDVVANKGDSTARFYADVLLISKYTRAGETEYISDPLTSGYVKTTYEQTLKDTEFFAVNSKIGTNSFVLPETRNIYDGKSVVISDEINTYDAIVINDLRSAIRNAIDVYNNEPTRADTAKINVGDFEAQFSGQFVPLINIPNTDTIEKTTTIDIYDYADAGGVARYFYTGTCQYKIIANINLKANSGSSVGIDSVVGASLTPAGGASYFTIDRLGNEYTIVYSQPVDSSILGASSGTKATFWGEIKADGVNVLSDGSGDPLPYVYMIYKPFNTYNCSTLAASDKVISNDIVDIRYSTPSITKNDIKIFVVGQETIYGKDSTKKVILDNIKDTANKDYLKIYTNYSEAFTTNGGVNGLDKKNYLTNSYGKERINHYEMEILVKDGAGSTANVVARYSTVKED